MAWTRDGAAGGVAEFVSDASTTHAPTVTLEVGKVAIAITAQDNAGTVSGVLSQEARYSDSAGNRWIKCGEVIRTAGVANDGVVGAVFMSVITNELTTGSTMTLTLTSSRTAKVMLLEEFSIGPNKVPLVVGVKIAVGGSTTPTVTCNPGAGPATSRLWIGAVFREGPEADTFTQDANFTNLETDGKIGTTNATAAANVGIVAGYRISASDTTETYNPVLGTSRDWATMLIAIDEADPDPVLGKLLTEATPRAIWPFAEWTGDIAVDYAGQNPAQYLTLTGGTHGYNQAKLQTQFAWGAHRFQAATATTGVYASVPTHTDLDLGNGPLTLLMFGKFQSVPSQNHEWIRRTACYQIFYEGSVADIMSLNQPGVGAVRLGTTAWTDTVSRFWAVTKNGATSHVYRDGILDDGTLTDKTLTNTANPVTMGGNPVSAVFNDTHYQMTAIFASEFTATDVAELWSAATVPQPFAPRNTQMTQLLSN